MVSSQQAAQASALGGLIVGGFTYVLLVTTKLDPAFTAGLVGLATIVVAYVGMIHKKK